MASRTMPILAPSPVLAFDARTARARIRRLAISFSVGMAAAFTLLALNLMIFRDSLQGFNYQMVPYYTAYYPEELPALQEFRFEPDGSLGVVICPPCGEAEWRVALEGGPVEIQRGPYPLLHLPTESQSYQRTVTIASSAFPQTIELEVERQSIGDVHVIRSSIPFVRVPRHPLAAFADLSRYDADQVARARATVNRLGLLGEPDTMRRIERLAMYLRAVTREGMSKVWAPEMATAGGATMLEYGATGRSRIACNEYSEMYYLHANAAGVPTRRVGVVGRADADGVVKLSGHHFNESFVAEQGRWAFVDLTSDKAYVVNVAGQVLNTWELFIANASANYAGLRTMSLESEQPAMVAYEVARTSEDYYFSPNATVLFKLGGERNSRWSQVTRYLARPEPALSLTETNLRLRLKQAAVIGFVIIAIADLVLLLLLLIAWRRARHSAGTGFRPAAP